MSLGRLGASAEETEVVESLLSSVDRLFVDRPALAVDRSARIPAELLRALAELGLFGMSIPEAYGGAGLSLQAVGAVIAGLARRDRAVATTVGLHVGLGTRGLVAYGVEAQKQAYLPRLAAGELIAAFAATEASAGSDLGAVRARAAPCPGGLCVEGEKLYVTNAHLAGLYTVLVSSPGLGGARRGQSLVLLERGDEGLELGAEERKLGLRGSSTAALRMQGIVVPPSRLLGEPGAGRALVDHILAWGRIAMAAGCVGAARAALQQAQEHVVARSQFGRPLLAFDVVAAQLGAMQALHYGMEALVRRAAAEAASPPRLLARSVAAKVFASEASWQIVDTAVQLHGGAGFIEDTGLPLLLRDARIPRIFEGANDVLRVRLGTQAASSTEDARAPLGHRPADELRQRVREELAVLREAMGVRLLGAQLHLHRIGHGLVWLEALDAAVLRARAEGRPDGDPVLTLLTELTRQQVEAALALPLPLDAVQRVREQIIEECRP